MMSDGFDRRIRALLEKSGKLKPEQLEQANEIAARDKIPLAQAITEKNLLPEKTFAGLLAREANLPPIDLDLLEIDEQAAELIDRGAAEAHLVLPVSKIGSCLTIALANPFDVPLLDHLKAKTGCELRPLVAPYAAVKRAVTALYRRDEKKMEELLGGDEGEIDVKADSKEDSVDLADIGGGEEDSKVVKAVNMILYQAAVEKVSDIHIEPFEKKTRVRFRKDGVLREAHTLGKATHNAMLSRLKIMASLDIAERRKPQDGKFQIRVNGRQIDLRLSILPVVHGEKAVLRLLDSSNLVLSLDDLGFEPGSLETLRRGIAAPYGMILVTGPTGSGKSTTLYSMVNELMTDDDNFITVEDPVEYQLEGVNQVPVNPKRGLTFAAALRSILRQDPDVIMVGEIRDPETLDIAIKAALTGHLVLSTLHTNDAPSTLTRMIQMGVDPFLVASSTIVVCAQRLARKLCQFCKKPVEAPVERLVEVGMSEAEAKTAKIFQPVGCAKCSGGYKGRFAVLETLEITEAIKEIILRGGNELEVRRAGMKQGMVTLRQAGLANVRRGVTSVEEVLRVSAADGAEPTTKPARAAAATPPSGEGDD
ncbi:MAG TPA: ATPase, T2SS/T4P/T4SS family [Planctomycetota bacterium]|nr:ATPase, T2SS/T4P/T4SS family [Planctomycetota bacterium]